MTDSNSVELFDVEFFLTENQTSKVEILLFWGFVLPSDFPKSGGDPVSSQFTYALMDKYSMNNNRGHLVGQLTDCFNAGGGKDW